jgi:hypothetical protein
LTETNQILAGFSPISLEEMDSVKLLNRVDTKFVLSREQLTQILPELSKFYQVLEIQGLRSARYQSLYFDTPKLKYYLNHHNGKPNRFKVRIRKYLDSNLCFLEIKHKKKGRTDKKRIVISDFEEELSENSVAFIHKHIKSKPILHTTLWNTFERITLVNNELKERLTLDLGLNFTWDGKQYGYNDIVIAELKQEMSDRMSPSYATFKNHAIRENRMSKYCIGMGLIYRDLKINNFKKKYILLNKLQEQEYDKFNLLDRYYAPQIG